MIGSIARAAVMAIATVCVVGVQSTNAQVAPPAQDDQLRSRIRIRGISLNPSVAVSNVGVDSNVFNEVAAPKSDLTLTFSPAMDGWLRLGRMQFRTRAQGDLVYFQKFHTERSADGGVAGRFELPFNRITPWATGGIYSGRQRLGYEIDVRSRHSLATVGGGIDYRVGSKSIVGVGVSRAQTTWSGDEQSLGLALKRQLDRRADAVHVGYRHAVTVLTTAVIEATAQTERFVFAPERNSDAVRIGAGFDLKPLALINGSIRVGYNKFDAIGQAFDSFKGFMLHGDLGYVLRGGTRLAVQADRDTVYSYDPLYPYYVQTGAALTITQRITARWDLQARGLRQQLAYRPLTASGVALQSRVDRVLQLGIGAGYRLNSDARIGVNVDNVVRRSPLQQRDYNGFRAGMAITYAR